MGAAVQLTATMMRVLLIISFLMVLHVVNSQNELCSRCRPQCCKVIRCRKDACPKCFLKLIDCPSECPCNVGSGPIDGDESPFCGPPACNLVCNPNQQRCVNTGAVCVRAPCCAAHACQTINRNDG